MRTGTVQTYIKQRKKSASFFNLIIKIINVPYDTKLIERKKISCITLYWGNVVNVQK